MFRHVVEVLAGVLVLSSLFAFYQSLTLLAGQDYVATILVAVVGLALMRAGVELARSALCD